MTVQSLQTTAWPRYSGPVDPDAVLVYSASSGAVNTRGTAKEVDRWFVPPQGVPVCLDHDPLKPVGWATHIRVERRSNSSRLVADVRLHPAGTSQLADQAREKLRSGRLRSISVGSRITAWSRRPDGVKVPKHQTLRELTITDTPANPDAYLIDVRPATTSKRSSPFPTPSDASTKSMRPIFKEAALISNAAGLDPDAPLTFVASTEGLDRYGDIVRASGWDLAGFRKNPIVLYGHRHDAVVGAATRVWLEAKRLLVEIKLAAQGTSALVDSVRELVRQGILRAVSVGFLPLEEPKPIRDEKTARPVGYEFTKQELLEVSLVAVPANAEALALARALRLSSDDQRALFGSSSSQSTMSAQRARVELERLRFREAATSTPALFRTGHVGSSTARAPMSAQRARVELERLRGGEKYVVHTS